MDRKLLNETVEKVLAVRDCFLVDISVSSDNDVTVTIEKESGSIDMDDCIAVNDAVLDAFDRDVEDFALTVTSAGLDLPFKVQRQFNKALGSAVEVLVKGGRKLIATLVAADAESITVKYSAKEAVEGSKKKQMVEHEEVLQLSDVNAVRYHIEFSDKK
ncbi:MAG: ribosome assembly cofactor RimP [Bacteroidales bacterium]|nr:ribosome assembly cofactor RimP [Bacteroidales bacterium]